MALALTALVAASSAASALVPVRGTVCKEEVQGNVCREWAVADLPSIHVVLSYWEDGGDETFYQIGKGGTQTPIVSFVSIVGDSKGVDWIGYLSELRALPHEVRNGELRVWAAFDPKLPDDRTGCFPAWQERLPFVRFEGESRDSAWKIKVPTLRLVSVKELAAKAHLPHKGSKRSCSALK